MKTDFISFKSEILERCTDHVEVVESEAFYNLKDAKDFGELFCYMCDSFDLLAGYYNVIDDAIITKYKELFNSNGIYLNENKDDDYMLVTGSIDKIGGKCTAVIKGHAVVDFICDSATICYIGGYAIVGNIIGKDVIVQEVRDKSVVRVIADAECYAVHGDAKIYEVKGSCYVDNVYDNAFIYDLADYATIGELADNAKIDYAFDSSEVCRVKGEATVCHVKGGARINTRN